jgi:hypothetical protein
MKRSITRNGGLRVNSPHLKQPGKITRCHLRGVLSGRRDVVPPADMTVTCQCIVHEDIQAAAAIRKTLSQPEGTLNCAKTKKGLPE